MRGAEDSAEVARLCARVGDEKKGEDIIILDLTSLTYITDYFVIITTGNPRQMDAVSGAIQEAMAERHVRPVGTEGARGGRWVLLDYGDVVVHVFDREWRRLYDLELLWGDAPRLRWQGGPARQER